MIQKIFVYLLSAGIPAGIFILIAQFLVNNIYGDYILYCVGLTLAGLGLSYIAPILGFKCKVTKLM